MEIRSKQWIQIIATFKGRKYLRYVANCYKKYVYSVAIFWLIRILVLSAPFIGSEAIYRSFALCAMFYPKFANARADLTWLDAEF